MQNLVSWWMHVQRAVARLCTVWIRLSFRCPTRPWRSRLLPADGRSNSWQKSVKRLVRMSTASVMDLYGTGTTMYSGLQTGDTTFSIKCILPYTSPGFGVRGRALGWLLCCLKIHVAGEATAKLCRAQIELKNWTVVCQEGGVHVSQCPTTGDANVTLYYYHLTDTSIGDLV